MKDAAQVGEDKMNERTTMYVTGSAGSGKSYFVAKYTEEYHKTFKTKPFTALFV